jgi:hypothetical protein
MEEEINMPELTTIENTARYDFDAEHGQYRGPVRYGSREVAIDPVIAQQRRDREVGYQKTLVAEAHRRLGALLRTPLQTVERRTVRLYPGMADYPGDFVW